MHDEKADASQPEITLSTDGEGRWQKRVWGAQCPEMILLVDRCQGVVGHQGDHWCFRPSGAYHYRPHESDPRRQHVGCATIPPGNAGYRTPLEMSRYHFLNFHDDTEVTDAAELMRMERGDFRPEEQVSRPCADAEVEQLRQAGRLESDDRHTRRERSATLKPRMNDFLEKSTTAQIAARFDADVERFSSLETGQSATMDALLSMHLITEAAVRLTPAIDRTLDIGCGAGNNTLALRRVYGKPFASDLLDLSRPMLERASERVLASGIDTVTTWHADLREADLPKESYDVVLAAAVLHHLRGDEDWQAAFEKVISVLRPGGSFWITDLVAHETVPIGELMWSRYGNYLEDQGGAEYRQKVVEYIGREDSPRPVTYQLDLLRRVGFAHVELLHKNGCFAAFGAWKE